ncbi:MAG: ABC transporter ATP-binding protein/permease [Bacilli bacterium]|nr:ABC transporter ATP-binding protein/permease [Bacilli bacterium]
MLKLVNIKKDYIVKGLEPVHALKGITLNFRKNEMAAILGPSGCGKTTLLNIIGGLDRYSEGDLIISGKTTKHFNDRDWDTYRNHSIGFVFQSYNLVSHLTIQANVELALSIGGYKKNERIAKAKEALDRVGLGGMYNKKPNQLSGGQMQRVAIARALVTNPEILLADEPTGALDSETSIQIMDLLKEVSKDRLVIVVTHNPELANAYADRIIRMKDGEIESDSHPYKGMSEKQLAKIVEEEKPTAKAKMKITTSFGLSLRNLISKYKRTSLVCVAGSIGIIGVSCVLAVSTGVRGYIDSMEDDMLSGNPITIEKTTVDFMGLMSSFSKTSQANALKNSIEDGKVNIDSMIKYLSEQKENLESYSMNNAIDENYVQFINQMPNDYYSALNFEYGINFKNNIFTTVNMTKTISEYEGTTIDRTLSLRALEDMYTSIVKDTPFGEYASIISLLTDTFFVAPDNSDYILSQYDIISGENSKIAIEEDEMMIVVSKDRQLTDVFLGQLGYYSQDQFVALVNKYADPSEDNPYNDVDTGGDKISYEKLLNKEFYYVPYSENNDFLFKNNPMNPFPTSPTDMPLYYTSEVDSASSLPDNARKIKITAILQPKEDVSYGCLQTGLVVSNKFQQFLLEDSFKSNVREVLNSRLDYYNNLGVQVEGQPVKDEATLLKEEEIKSTYSLLIPYAYKYDYSIAENGRIKYISSPMKTSSVISVVNLESTGGIGGGFSDVITKMFGNQYSIENQFETAIRSIGGIKEIPSKISIYPKSFDEKYLVTDYLDSWNNKDVTITLFSDVEGHDEVVLNGEDREEITYNDNLQIIISLISTMIDIITIALLCFTSLSLVVSTVMIGIITYVSVIERVKEIGIIRSLGGRKMDVSNLFNAETFMIGLTSGVFGIGVTYLISLILNAVINNFASIGSIIYLPIPTALIVILISVGLTLISGLIPARAAAKKDPVVALRTE